MTSGDNALSLTVEQPQSLCDVIGLAFRIWRRHLKLIISTLFLPTIFYFAATGTLQWCVTYGITGKSDFLRIATAVCLIIAAIFVFLVAVIWLAYKQVALVRLFCGFAPDWAKACAFARKRFWWLPGLFAISVLLSGVVMGVWICIIVLLGGVLQATGPAGTVIASVFMILALIGMCMSAALLMLVCMMGFAVLSCEETTFFGVIGRAFHWTFSQFGRVLCFGFMYYVIFSVVSMPVSLPVIVVSVGDIILHQIKSGAAASVDYKVSLAALLFVQVWEALCSLLLRPVIVIAFGLFYLDLRRRVEGLDMSSKLRELKAAVDGAGDGIQGR